MDSGRRRRNLVGAADSVHYYTMVGESFSLAYVWPGGASRSLPGVVPALLPLPAGWSVQLAPSSTPVWLSMRSQNAVTGTLNGFSRSPTQREHAYNSPTFYVARLYDHLYVFVEVIRISERQSCPGPFGPNVLFFT